MKHTIYLFSLLFTASIAQAAPPNLASTDAHTYFNQVRQKMGMMEFFPHWQSETVGTADSSLLDPFVNTNWEFRISYSDKCEDFPVSTYLFDTSTMTLEDGTIGLAATDDAEGKWILWYEGTESFYVLATNADNGGILMYSFNCDTPACDSTISGVFETLYPDDSVSEPRQFTGYRHTLSPLGKANNADTFFRGGIAINGGEYQTQIMQSLHDNVDILGEMIVDCKHVGQEADIFIYAETTLPPLEGVFYFMLDEGKTILPWDQNPANLVALIPAIRLNQLETVPLYQGTFYYHGTLKVHFGYRLTDGTVVTSGEPIEIAIN